MSITCILSISVTLIQVWIWKPLLTVRSVSALAVSFSVSESFLPFPYIINGFLPAALPLETVLDQASWDIRWVNSAARKRER